MTDTVPSLIAKLLRDQPRNPTVEALAKAIEAERKVVTPVVMTVTPVVTPKRDRAKYMRNYRAAQSSAGNNGRPKIQPPPV